PAKRTRIQVIENRASCTFMDEPCGHTENPSKSVRDAFRKADLHRADPSGNSTAMLANTLMRFQDSRANRYSMNTHNASCEIYSMRCASALSAASKYPIWGVIEIRH
ncbi:MAG: hypothetical protein KUL79_08055, partial [Thauera sp.]|nr:hypothetical protein [Thauera sp.]